MLAWFQKFSEIVIVTLLGIVSVSTAYVSFQASLYDSKMFKEYTVAQNMKTEAESMYLEANQQYAQDAQTLVALDQLNVEILSNSSVTELAKEKYDALYFGGVSEEFGEAIDRAAAERDLTGEYISPQEDEQYLDFLFGPYEEKSVAAEDQTKQGDLFNTHADKLILYTVLMAICLFLLGVAAVVSRSQTKFVISLISLGIFAFTATLASLIPFTGIE
jgi:hypothetical protein